ncbi:MAG: glycosyltransferase, partial [Clostridiales bacterium]|nr:glycosyltransferase [Clostridiales bacterium]
MGIDNDKKVLLFYGGIRESKGLDILLNALKGLPVKLIIAGAMPYGEQFDKYQHIINSNKIDTLQIIQFTEDSFRDVLFQVSDFLVLPYKEFYSQSGVFMQAIQYHLPIIATDVSSFKYYVEHYDIGYICAPNNIDNLHHT